MGLKDEPFHRLEKAVNCLLEGRDVFAVMPTGYGKSFIFQLFATAMTIKKVREGQHTDTVVLAICTLTGIIQDQVKEGKSLDFRDEGFFDASLFRDTFLLEGLVWLQLWLAADAYFE